MKIAIRADASVAIGSGHIRRCLALAYQARLLGADVRFVTRDLGFDTRAMVRAAGYRCELLPAPSELAAPDPAVPHAHWAGVAADVDAAQTAVTLAPWAPDWVVVDHYGFDARWHRTARAALGCRVAVIDDLADRALAADLVVDHNHAPDHGAKYAGRITDRTRLLGGPRFALLGPAFAEAPRYLPREGVASIGVFMGGIDGANASMRVIEAIGASSFTGPVEIVSTAQNPNLPELQAAVAARPGATLSLDLPDLAGFFARHDLQVGAGGGASWERCCIGAPTLLLVVADNQRAVVPDLADMGVIATTQPLGAMDVPAIAAAIDALIADPTQRAAMATQACALVDGLGARRVALALMADSVRVRPATRGDAEIAWRWRNDPATRAVSRDNTEIAWEAHLGWFERTLANPDRRLLIAQIGSVPIGVIRFDALDAGRAEVSLYLDPALHGVGLGRSMLLAGEAAGAQGKDIVAEVLDGNIGSARLFASAGYAAMDAGHWIKSAVTPMVKEDAHENR